jgi:hypothetical protein
MEVVQKIVVPCEICRISCRCIQSDDMHHQAITAWSEDRPEVNCPHYQPRWFRGIEGVLEHAISPRPFQRSLQKREGDHAKHQPDYAVDSEANRL